MLQMFDKENWKKGGIENLSKVKFGGKKHRRSGGKSWGEEVGERSPADEDSAVHLSRAKGGVRKKAKG